MQRKVERALVAKVGTLVFAVTLGVPAMVSPLSASASVYVASAEQDVVVRTTTASVLVDASPIVELPELRPPPAARDLAVASTVVEDTSPAPAPAASVAPVPVLAVAAVPTFAPPEPLIADGVVVASWYGPGFYGNRTACGQTYTPEIMGVAHRLLACGTPVRITSPAGVTVVVPVIDRGPYVAGRSLDLSSATRLALSCSDLCPVRMIVIK